MSDRQFKGAAAAALQQKKQEHAEYLMEARTASIEELRLHQGALLGLDEASVILDEVYQQIHG